MTRMTCIHLYREDYAICARCLVILATPSELAAMDARNRPAADVKSERGCTA